MQPEKPPESPCKGGLKDRKCPLLSCEVLYVKILAILAVIFIPVGIISPYWGI